MREPVHHAEELEVLAAGEAPVERPVVGEDQTDPVPDRPGVVARVVPVDEHVPRRRLEQRRDDLEQRRLAGAVGADESHHLTARDVQVDVAQGDDLMIGRGHARRGA